MNSSRVTRIAIIFLTFIACLPAALAKRKDDVVVMKNGDRFTGEIKQLVRGELAFKATYMSAEVDLNWQDVARLESRDAFIFSLVDGTRVAGLFSPATAANGGFVIKVADGGKKASIAQTDVLEIKQAEESYLNQLTGSVDFGFSFANGNQSADYSSAFVVGYRAKRDEYSLNASSDFNRNDADGTARHNLTLDYRHMITEKWFTIGLSDLLHSEQQELSLRTTLGAGFGRRLYQTQHTRVAVIGGAAYSHESYSPNAIGAQERSNGEALVGLQFNTFRFKTLAIGSSLNVFPSMTEPGRVRLVTNGDLKIELVRNLYWRFRAYENFDNRPPVNAPRNDFGTSSSLGWSF
jgi:putative salt-induced outer membrane protein YdiY